MNMSRAEPTANGGVSFWWADLGGAPAAGGRRRALEMSTTADVCIVGGGYTGLWTAYYLAKAAPELRISCWSRSSAATARRDVTAAG